MKKAGWILLAVLLGCGGAEEADRKETPEPAASSIDLSTMADPCSYVLEEVCWNVPYIYRYLQRMELTAEDGTQYTDDDGTVYYSTETGVNENGAFRAVRRFAMSQDGTELYEYDAWREEWYLREDSCPVLAKERIRTDLLYQDLIAGYAWTGEDGMSAEWAGICPWAADLPVVDAGGTDTYLIVPRSDRASAAVHRLEDGEAGEVLYSQENGSPFIIKTGSPTSIPEAVVRVTEDDRVMDLYLYHLNQPGCWDAAHDESAMNFGSVDYLWTIEDNDRIGKVLCEAVDDLEGLIGRGLTMEEGPHGTVELQYHPCWEIHYGTNHDGVFTRERTYAVSDDYHHVFIYDPVSDEWSECTD